MWEHMMKDTPSQSSPAADASGSETEKTGRKKAMVTCATCGIQVAKKKLEKHKVTAHPSPADIKERKRVEALKKDLQFLNKKKASLPAGTIDLQLIESIAALRKAIRTPSATKRSWSPILPGSFGSGKRR